MRAMHSPSGQEQQQQQQPASAPTSHFQQTTTARPPQVSMANHMSSQMGMFPGNMAHVHVPNAFQDPAIAAATPAFSVNMPDASGRAQQSHHHVVDPSLEMASHRDSGGMGQGQGPHVAFAPMATGPMQDMPEPPHFMVPAGEQPETQNGAGEHTAVPRRLVVDPPNLQEWRQRLFDADELIILTNDQ
jgi:hypothetical protein